MLRFLVFHNGEAFFTPYFFTENHYLPGMVVFNLQMGLITTDGINWKDIAEYHL